MKKTVILALALALMMIAASCTPAATTPASTTKATTTSATTGTSATTTEPVATTTGQVKPVNCNYVLPGSALAMNDAVDAAINEKLAADGVGITLSRTYIPWDAWQQKINIMLSTNQPFDLFHVMQDWIPFSSYLANGGLMDITDYITQFGQNITRTIPADIMEGATLNGKIYAIPANWVELAGDGLTWRSDLDSIYGLTIPTSPDDVLTQMKKASDNWKGTLYKNYFIFSSNTADYDPAELSVLYKPLAEYANDNFIVKEKIFQVFQSGKVTAFIQSESFKYACEYYGRAQDMGLMNPDLLVFQPDQRDSLLKSGDWLCMFGGDTTSITDIQKLYPNYNRDSQKFFEFTTLPALRGLTVKNCNSVPVTSIHPEVGVKFLDWVYANQDNYDLYMYGIEGTTFTKTGPKTYMPINDATTNTSLYAGDEFWEAGNLAYQRAGDDTPTCSATLYYTINPNAKNSIAATFVFDATQVQAELANVKTVWTSDGVPMLFGFVKYADGYDKFLQKMKDAGLDIVVNEYQKQLDAFVAAKK